jgi:ATP-dependent exoDNAse (exonuclease V) beta subunit
MALWVYRAAAGSGKTFTLVREYLRLSLSAREVDGFKHLLAVTFTNKAAGEMKARVLQALAEFAGKSDSKRFGVMFEQLQAELGLEASALRDRSEQVLTAMLHRYQQLSIGTIDSFVARLARQFASELLLDQQFEVVLDTKLLLAQTVERLLERLGQEPVLTDILTRLAFEQMEQDKSWHIRGELQQFAEQLLRDDMRHILPRLKTSDAAQFGAERQALRQKAQQLSAQFALPAQELLDRLNQAGIQQSDLFNSGRGLMNPWTGCAQGEIIEFKDTYTKCIDKQQWVGGKASAAAKAWLQANAAWLSSQSEKIMLAHEQCKKELKLTRAILKRQYASATLALLQQELDGWMEAQAAVPLPVLYFRLAEVLAESATPYIFERLGNLYRHFLIDEFQDTSVLQWNNLLPLVENGLSGGNDSLLVGDAKQSIYRWRSGDANQFVQLPQQRDGSAGSALLTDAYRLVQLNTNFRSYRTVIDFNNRFFRWYVDRQSAPRVHAFYEGLEQLGGKAGGLVQVKLLPAPAPESNYIEQRQQEVVALVAELRQKGVPYGEMAVLVRKNKLGSALAEALIAAGVPVISGESLLLYRQPVVRLFWVCLRWLLYPNDTLNLQQGKLLLSQIHDEPLSAHESWEEQVQRLYGKRLPSKQWKQLPTAELPEQVLHFFGLLNQPDPFVLRLLDVVRDKSSKWHQPDELLQWWAEQGSNIALPMPEKGDAVRVMTYHKSKGLEFGVVIIADADQLKDELSEKAKWISTDITNSGVAWVSTHDLAHAPDPYPALFEEEQEMSRLDYLNTLYVAFTRAVGALYILGSSEKGAAHSFSKQFPTFAQQSGWDGVDFFEIGSLPMFEPAAETSNPVLGSHYWSDWRERLALQHRFEGTQEMQEALSLGNAAHGILAALPDASALERVIEHQLQTGEISMAQVDVLLPALRQLLEQEQLQPYFAAGVEVRNEAAILGTDGRMHRPDRVVFLPNEVVVLEFKTGLPLPKHQEQLATYVGLLQQMGLAAKGELVYLQIEEA